MSNIIYYSCCNFSVFIRMFSLSFNRVRDMKALAQCVMTGVSPAFSSCTVCLFADH